MFDWCLLKNGMPSHFSRKQGYNPLGNSAVELQGCGLNSFLCPRQPKFNWNWKRLVKEQNECRNKITNGYTILQIFQICTQFFVVNAPFLGIGGLWSEK